MKNQIPPTPRPRPQKIQNNDTLKAINIDNTKDSCLQNNNSELNQNRKNQEEENQQIDNDGFIKITKHRSKKPKATTPLSPGRNYINPVGQTPTSPGKTTIKPVSIQGTEETTQDSTKWAFDIPNEDDNLSGKAKNITKQPSEP